VPTLTDEVIEVRMPASVLEAELQRVVRLAHGVGGGASSYNDGETVRIVANVPKSSESLFRQAVNSNVLSLTAAGESESMTIVQIVLRPEQER
jgi:hypothetical protein